MMISHACTYPIVKYVCVCFFFVGFLMDNHHYENDVKQNEIKKKICVSIKNQHLTPPQTRKTAVNM